MNRSSAAFHALHAIATWDVGDAALLLAEALDVARPIQVRATAARTQYSAVTAAYGRAAESGKTLQPGALAVLARQAFAVQDIQEAAQAQLDQANHQVDERRQLLHLRQAHAEALHHLLKRHEGELRAERMRKEAFALDDLYLARRAYNEPS